MLFPICIQYRVEFMSAGCVRILSFPEGDTLVTKRLVGDSEKPAFKDYKWEDTGQKLLFRTRELSVVFDKADAAFIFQETSTGKLLLKEKGDRKARNFKRSVAGGNRCIVRNLSCEVLSKGNLQNYQTGC